MYSNNKQIRDVADVAARIMSGQQPVTEKLHPNQQQLDVHEPEKDELTADDFKKLRAKKEVKKEEVEELDELSKDTLKSYYKGSVESGMKAQNRATNTSMGGSDSEHKKNIADINKRVSGQDAVTKRLGSKETMSMDKEAGVSRLAKYKPTKPNPKKYSEEVEPIDEVKMSDLPSTKVQGRSYGASKPEPSAFDVLKGPKEKELKDIEAEKKKKQKKFSEMVNLYQEKGLKSLSEMLVKEEPDNEQFTKELEDAKAKSEGKKKNTEIAKGSVQAVKSEEVEIVYEANIEPTSAKSRSHIGNLSHPVVNSVVHSGKEIGLITKQSSGEYHAHHSAAKLAHAQSGTFDNKDKAHQFIRDAHAKAIKNGTLKSGGVQKEDAQIEERMMTEPEKEKKEEIVKGMKKGLTGFKDRYGSRANDVMYATATKRAMK